MINPLKAFTSAVAKLPRAMRDKMASKAPDVVQGSPMWPG